MPAKRFWKDVSATLKSANFHAQYEEAAGRTRGFAVPVQEWVNAVWPPENMRSEPDRVRRFPPPVHHIREIVHQSDSAVLGRGFIFPRENIARMIFDRARMMTGNGP